MDAGGAGGEHGMTKEEPMLGKAKGREVGREIVTNVGPKRPEPEDR